MPFNNELHLFVVLTDPCRDRMCLAVMLTSIKKGRAYDPTCTFTGGEHPFIKHGTYALYRMADEHSAVYMGKMVEKGVFIPRDDASPEMLKALTDGLFNSDEARPRIIKYAERQGI